MSILYIIIGLAGGSVVAGGLFSFIISVGVVSRIVARTRTAKRVKMVEDIVVLGGTIGNLYYVFCWKLPIGVVGLLLYGIASGVFVGCLAVSIAEVLQVIPIFSKRIRLNFGMREIIVSFAIGKAIGTIVYLLN